MKGVSDCIEQGAWDTHLLGHLGQAGEPLAGVLSYYRDFCSRVSKSYFGKEDQLLTSGSIMAWTWL